MRTAGRNGYIDHFLIFSVTFYLIRTNYTVEDARIRQILDSDQDIQLAGLLAEGQKGDHAAYEKFLMEASIVLRRFLLRRMNDPGMAEDVLQDTLLSIHRARHTHIPGRPVGPWMYAICGHRMMDFYRWHRRIEKVEITLTEDIDPQSDENKHGRSVLEALAGLPQKQRQVIKLLKVQGLSVKEVSAVTGMSESSVKVTAFRGYESIRQIFGVDKK